MIEIKTFFSDWQRVSATAALSYYNTFCAGANALCGDEKRIYFNNKHIRGAYIDENNELKEENNND